MSSEKYLRLVEQSNLVSKSILGDGVRQARPIKTSNVHYLIFNINPSDAKENTKNELFESGNYLCTLGRFSKSDFATKKVKKNHELKGKIYWPYFYDKSYQLIEELDPNVCMYWEKDSLLLEILEKLKAMGKHVESETIQQLIDESSKYKLERKNILVFAELVYCMKQEQRKIEDEISENKEKAKLVLELLECQLDYYRPKIVLVTNAWVSKFIHQHYLGGNAVAMNEKFRPTQTTCIDPKTSIRFVFAPMLAGTRSIDDYSFLRLKSELRKILEDERMMD